MKVKHFLFAIVFAVSSVVVVDAQTARLNLKRGDALVAQENYQSAIEEYSKVSDRDGDLFARAIYNIGVCHYELWETDRAIVFYRRAIELKHGNYPKASHALGVALEDEGKLLEAKQAYEQAVRKHFAPASYKLGLLEAKAGELKRAADLFRDAASHKGQHVAASHNNLGVMLAQLGALKEAEKEFVIALKESNGKFDDAVHNLGLCRLLMSSAGLQASQNFRLSKTGHIL